MSEKEYESKSAEELLQEEEEDVSLKDALKQTAKRHPFLTGLAIVLTGGLAVAGAVGIYAGAKRLKEKFSESEDPTEDDFEDKTSEEENV